MEVILSSVFSLSFPTTSGPETGLFKRFQKAWPNINTENFTPAENHCFDNNILAAWRTDMMEYLPNALQKQKPRDDYKEFLQLSSIFLGGDIPNYNFRRPGAMHYARWMAKGIYALKVYLFRTEFRLTPTEQRQVTDIALFVSLVYIKYWNEAPLAAYAPLNDVQFWTKTPLALVTKLRWR